jgi:hypothetical protein
MFPEPNQPQKLDTGGHYGQSLQLQMWLFAVFAIALIDYYHTEFNMTYTELPLPALLPRPR